MDREDVEYNISIDSTAEILWSETKEFQPVKRHHIDWSTRK